MPGPNRNVNRTSISRGRCRIDPGRDSPYAAPMVSTIDSAVPPAVSRSVRSRELVSAPPPRMSWYAWMLRSVGSRSRFPPAAWSAFSLARLVATTAQIGRTIAAA
jgi:hypothetical protein